MENSSEETLKFKRVLIILAVVEFVVTAVGLFYYVQK
jgi:hypothetical protein